MAKVMAGVLASVCALAVLRGQEAPPAQVKDAWTLALVKPGETRDLPKSGGDRARSGWSVDGYFKMPCGLDGVSEQGMVLFSWDGGTGGLVLDKGGFLIWKDGGVVVGAVPVAGPHAMEPGKWVHVAVVLSNTPAVARTRVYWTRLDARPGWAHRVGETEQGVSLGEMRGFQVGPGFSGQTGDARLSRIARDETDFAYVPERARKTPGVSFTPIVAMEQLELHLTAVHVNGMSVPPGEARGMRLGAGLHNVDVDFGVPLGATSHEVKIRSRLRGFEEEWASTSLGMVMSVEVLDATGHVVSVLRHELRGSREGSDGGADFAKQSEPLHIPQSGHQLRVMLGSGVPDTRGTCVVRELKMTGADGKPIFDTADLARGLRSGDVTGVPMGWKRAGMAPGIARVDWSSGKTGLGLMDVDASASGAWVMEHDLSPTGPGGTTCLLSWEEDYDVEPGLSHRSSYTNVPPGDYVFEAVAVSLHEPHGQASLILPFSIDRPATDKPWFWGVLAACIVGSLAVGVVAVWRQMAARKLARLKLQNAVADDRARIARDMHDDLGTRITLLTMNASLVRRDAGEMPEAARKHLDNLAVSSRELVAAMDDLVWAVDPANDSLEDLGEHLSSMAHEIFAQSAVRCTVDIPLVLPDLELRSDFRHHVMLCAKEAMHNVLRHAGPCNATLEMRVADGRLRIVVSDEGRGFDPEHPDKGNGLGNYRRRMELVGGTAKVTSLPGQGTRVELSCPLPSALE